MNDQKIILIADDDEKMLSDLTTLLTSHGYTVKTVCDIKNLETELDEYDIDICIIDIVYKGYGVLDPYGIAARHPNTKFIVLSGYLDRIKPDNLVKFISKPQSINDILSAIESNL